MANINDSISVRSFLVRLFVAAFLLNWVWEISQMSFYDESGKSWLVKILGCTLVTVGDALLTILAYGIGALFTRNSRWGIGGGWKVYLTLAISGAGFAVIIEWIARAFGHWSYNDLMPIIPLIEVGLLPFLQLTILLPAALWIAMQWRKHKEEKKNV